jgi:hypothetical protein
MRYDTGMILNYLNKKNYIAYDFAPGSGYFITLFSISLNSDDNFANSTKSKFL